MILLLNEFVDISIYFLLIGIGLAPLERVFRKNRQPFFRKEWWTDVTFYLLQNMVWTKATLFCLIFIDGLTTNFDQSALRNFIMGLSFWAQTILVFFLSDLLIYWGHRLSHKSDLLWRFHRVHHTPVALDWAAAFREHPLDNIYTRILVNLPPLAMGFSLESVSTFVVFRGLWGNFIHSNTPFGLGPFKYILGSPRLHHWHHDIKYNSRCNFANLMPLMDVMFGTFYDPGKFPEKYGIPENISHNYFAQLITPFLPKKLRHKFNAKLVKR
ncbi:MAG: sterol desaturase family protein [Leptospirales bacterium]